MENELNHDQRNGGGNGSTNGNGNAGELNGDNHFASMLNIVFEKCKVILGYHRAVCEAFATLQQQKNEKEGVTQTHRPTMQRLFLDGTYHVCHIIIL